ncbi:hypothetical protein LZ654_20325 [Lelliottia amnigena]|jgi:hypothetical protein|uniref:gp53-like domain-containing protein n=1 Tax=Lelliottia amnigena TaxID=61646 RepID=UPI001F280A12|nr:hypothetical protein [Lelliottia amnigena]MCE9967156.1 hypothetical protein [Lelliottia amnigena]
MHRIDTPTAQKDKFGAGKNGFTRGNPQTGTPATDLDDDYFDMLQEELAGVVEASGSVLDKSKHNQLLTALSALLLSRSHPFADIKSDGALAVAEALANLGLGEAAKRGVGNGVNQIPDMSNFSFAGRWFKQPNGWMVQVGAVTLPQGVASGSSTYPVPFPNACIGTVITGLTASGVNPGILTINNTGLSTYGWWRFGSTDATSATVIAFGY